jgi:hypothetical protein
MDNKTIANNVSYSINNVALSVVTMLDLNITELGVLEYNEELEKLAQVKVLLEDIEKGVRRKSAGLKK